MRKNNKAALGLRTATILRDDAGASLVLVTIIAIIIITGVVILKITTSTLWASADKQYYQDRCYVMATSMGDSIDGLIQNGVIKLTDYSTGTTIVQPGQINASSTTSGDSTEVRIAPSGDGYIVTVTASAGNASYTYTAYYIKGSGSTYVRQII